MRYFAATMSKKAILIVDDDSSIRGLVRAVLRKEDFDADEATSGDEAITKLEAKRYDVVVLDIMMGGGSGYDVLKKIATECPDVKCVVVMSASSQANIDAVEMANVEAKLRKPFDINELLDAVHRCVER